MQVCARFHSYIYNRGAVNRRLRNGCKGRGWENGRVRRRREREREGGGGVDLDLDFKNF